MAIVQCSLQCSDSASGGGQITCGVSNVFVNQEIRVAFSSPIDRNSIGNNSFQLVEEGTGKTPAGSFSIDSVDPRILIYRPDVTFDSSGNPIFGLTEDRNYFFKIPGTALDNLGPYIRDTSGSPNTTRLQCTLIASEGVRDTTPGPPRADVFIRRILVDANGDPILDPDGHPIVEPNETPAPGATNVWRDTVVRIVFNDVMNPATLANPVTGQSSFIRAFVDADGNTTNDSDQVTLNGSFTVTIDQRVPPSTTVIFTPSGGLPSAGRDKDNPRKVVINLSPQIADLGGNPLVNPGPVAFTPERILFDPLIIEETFVDPSREDSGRTGSAWGSGFLATGPGGGSGRLGDLIVLPGTVVVLDTDFEDFSGITNPAIFNPANILERPDPPQTFTVVGGVFEFTRLRVDAGGLLRFEGSHPARVYVRGVADIQGQIDVSGASATLQAATSLAGGAGGSAGPNGGRGGRGGHRPDGSLFTGLFQGVPIGGVPNLGAGPAIVTDPATYTEVNGVAGGGIAAPSTIDPGAVFVAGGGAGLGWPQPTPANMDLHMPQDVTDLSGMEFDPYVLCQYPVPAAPGAGGGHALDGGVGHATFAFFSPVTPPPDAPAGETSALAIDDLVRSLSPELGFLRGGAGGGGAGAHLEFTAMNGIPLPPSNCNDPLVGTGLQISTYLAHSGAGGGGGGGGLQIAAGRRLNLAGTIDAAGGAGGSGTFPPEDPTRTDLAQAGGGGAGGGVLLQSERVQIQAVPGRIDISGGVGGQGTGSFAPPVQPSLGGLGSPGLLRIEATVQPDVHIEESKIVPLESDLKAQYGQTLTIEDIFTTAQWQPAVEAPSGWSGAQSCWIRPTGSFFRLVFAEDDAELLGWDVRLRIAGHPPQSFRGENALSDLTLEEEWGSAFGTSPVVVRFQGARAVSVLVDACAVPETGAGSPLAPNSLTEWVSHPAQLNNDIDQSQSANIFRFVILWDRSQPEFAQIEGVEDLTVTIQPD